MNGLWAEWLVNFLIAFVILVFPWDVYCQNKTTRKSTDLDIRWYIGSMFWSANLTPRRVHLFPPPLLCKSEPSMCWQLFEMGKGVDDLHCRVSHSWGVLKTRKLLITALSKNDCWSLVPGWLLPSVNSTQTSVYICHLQPHIVNIRHWWGFCEIQEQWWAALICCSCQV